MNTANRILALIGLSGSGKSTVGALLAQRLQLPLYDTDQLIVERTGRTIAAIFAEDGEVAFRDLETDVLQRVCSGTACILSTGGGIILRETNRTILRAAATVVWLDAPTATLVARLQTHDEERPLLQGDAAARLEALRAARTPIYAAVADLRIETQGQHPNAICDAILAGLLRIRQTTTTPTPGD